MLFPFIHVLPLFLNSFVPHFPPFAASCPGFFSSFSFLRVEVVQSSVHVSLQFPLEGLIHSQNFKSDFCASKSNICISSSDFSSEIQNLPTYIRIIWSICLSFCNTFKIFPELDLFSPPSPTGKWIHTKEILQKEHGLRLRHPWVTAHLSHLPSWMNSCKIYLSEPQFLIYQRGCCLS